MENYLWPLFRGLRASVVAASNSGQPTVITAKKMVGYAPESLDMLKAAATPKASKRQRDWAYDVYWRWVVQEDDKVVKNLTGKPRKFWLDFERRLERGAKTEGVMDIERVNSVLTKAILGFQDGEAEVLFSLGEAMAVGRTSYNVPAPGQMYKPPSPKAMGIKKVEPLTQKNVRKGMSLGSIWIVTKASPKSVSIALQRDQGKSYSYRWDGMGYGKQGSYLHTDGETRALGDAGPVEAKVRYPQGTLFFSKGYKWSFVVTGPPVKQSYGGVVYPGRKPKGSKVYQLWVHDGQVRAMSLRGKDDMTLYNAMARIPA